MEKQKRELIKRVLFLFREHGVAFRMEDVATGLKISKKTIYKLHGTKEDLMVMVVEAVFEGIESRLRAIIADPSLGTVEKLILVTSAHPDTSEVDYHTALRMKDDFPVAYQKFIQYIEDHWETKQALYEQGVREGVLRPVDFRIFRLILLGTIKQVLENGPEGHDELLETCIRQALSGFMKG